MTVAAVIFDVDGTLVDSNGLHAFAWERAFASLGLSVPFGRVLPFIGKAGDKLVSDLVSVDAATAKRLGEREPEEFERMARRGGISPYSGSEELLRELKGRGTQTAIARRPADAPDFRSSARPRISRRSARWTSS